jgi:iron complex outermembrane receptor protein
MKRHLLLAACAACVPLLAHAGDSSITTPETVVTASRFRDPASDLPVNLTVITAEDIARSPATTLPDLLALQAGINARDLFGNGGANASVDLRGFGATASQNLMVLLDGRRISDIDLSGVEWGVIPLAAIDRIEIMRGSGSVLYGGGAVGGVINIITRSPLAAQRALDVDVRAGNLDTQQAQLTGTVSGEHAGITLGGSYFHSGGYRENNENTTTAGYLDARWFDERNIVALKAGTDDLDLRLPGARRVDPAAGIDLLETDRRGTATPLDYATRTGYRATLDWEHQNERFDSTLGLGYRDKEQTSYFDFGGFPDYRETTLRVFSLTPRVRVPLADGRVNIVVGVDWYRWEYRLSKSNARANIDQPTNRVEADQDNTAGYLQVNARVTNTTSLTAGWRYEHQSIDATDRFDPTAPGAAFGSGASPGKQNEDQQAWEVGLRQELSQSLAALAHVGRAYRFATVDEIYESSAAFTNEFQFLHPQTSMSYDASLEYRTRSLSARVTAFQIDLDDEIFLDPFRTGVGNTNLPPSRRRGVELEARWQALSTLALGAAYTYIDARFREGTTDAFGNTVDLSGKHVPLVPAHHIAGQVTWDVLPRLQLNATVQWVSEQYMENDMPNNGTKIPSYTTADLRADYRVGAWRFTAAVNNLFDEKYYTYAVRSSFTPTAYNAYPLPERTYWVGVGYQFR